MKGWGIWKKRLAAVGLSMALAGGLAGLPADYVSASELQAAGTDVCKNHEIHDESCGYREATEGAPCSHEHTEECWQTEEACVHEHTEECYTEVILCGNTEDGHEHTEECWGAELDCMHECTEESGCVLRQSVCAHVHDAECGYAETVGEIPCAHVCEWCAPDAEISETEGNREYPDAAKDGEGEAESETESAGGAEEIQVLIDALPDADSITPETVREAESRLAAIDEWKAVLTEEELEEVDFGRYLAVAAVLEALAGEEGAGIPMPAAEVGDKFSSETEEGVAVTYQIITLPDDSGAGTVRVWGEFEDGEPGSKSSIDKGTEGMITIPAAVNFEGKSYRVVEIGSCAFVKCDNITGIKIPENITKIGSWAFYGCENLIEYKMPKEVAEIESHAFAECTSLKEIAIPDGVARIGDCAFIRCRNLMKVEMMEGVTEIGVGAFSGCKELSEIVLPESLTKISDGAFGSCTGLTKVIIPDSVTELGGFEGCINLSEVAIPESVTVIGYSAFKGCTGITEMILPNSVTEIGDCAFQGCVNLTKIVMPENLEIIGVQSFENCINLNEVIIPGHVTRIRACAFRKCVNLKEITIPESMIELGYGVFEGCIGLTDLTLLNGLTKIGPYAFNGCEKLEEVIIPESVTEIEHNVFFNCKGLANITLPGGITKIWRLFDGCERLTSITIPPNVTWIGDTTFNGCLSLKNVYMQGMTAPVVEWSHYISAFKNTSPDLTIYIPEGSEQSYSGEGWDDMNLVVYKRPVSQDTESEPDHQEESHSHSYGETIRKQPDCTEDGLREYICVCGSSYSAAIPALGHDFGGGEAGICIRCGENNPEAVDRRTEDSRLIYASAKAIISENDNQRNSQGDNQSTETSGTGKVYGEINSEKKTGSENQSGGEDERNGSNPGTVAEEQETGGELSAEDAAIAAKAETESQVSMPETVESIAKAENRKEYHWWILLAVMVVAAGGGIYVAVKKTKKV